MNLNLLKSGLLLATVCLSMSAMAQKRSINTAEFALESGNPDDLIIALEEIEKARQNEKTNNAARMWLIRSKVYSTIFDKKGNEMIKPLSKMSGLQSADSILKFYGITSDKKTSVVLEEAQFKVGAAFASSFNESMAFSEQFEKASSDEIKGKLNDTMVIYYQYLLDLYSKLDTGMINNLKGQKVERDFFVERIAFFALNNSNIVNRMKIMEDLTAKERPTPLMIESYSKELMTSGDTVGAYRVIKNALVKTNYDNDIFNVLVNYYLSINKEEKLMDEIQGQIQENPNSRIYWIRGYLNEKTQKYDEATADYKKSRELDEFNYDANWNLGVCLMKYETRKLLEGKTPSDPAAKAKIEQQRIKLFQEAKGYLEFALENPDYSKTELKDISKALRTCCLELNDNKCAGDYRDKIRELEGFSLSVGDKFIYQIDGNSNNMDISYQNNRNTVSTISLKADPKKGISVEKEFAAAGWVKNGYVWQKEFEYTDKSDMLSLSVRVNDESTVKGLILVNGVIVAEKEVDG
ncbi:MAG: hypothetical protein RL263_490, partial [Bacteroidota bacterium]